MRLFGIILIILIGTALFGMLVAMLLPVLMRGAQQPVMMQAVITLDNRCEVDDRAFVVKIQETGAMVPFNKGRARLTVRSDRHVMLATSPAFPDVAYDGDAYSPETEMTLVASCEASNHMRSVFGAFGKQFN